MLAFIVTVAWFILSFFNAEKWMNWLEMSQNEYITTATIIAIVIFCFFSVIEGRNKYYSRNHLR